MIEAISKIPKKILEAQIKKDGEEAKTNSKFIVVFLDEDFNVDKIDEGTFDEICESYKERTNKELSESKKNFIKKFNYYLGIDYAFDKYGNKGYGGQAGLYTCSLLHYNFSENTFKSIIKERKKVKINKTKGALEKDKIIPLRIKESLLKLIDNFFIDIVLNKKEANYELDFENKDSCRIVFIPSEDKFIEEYNRFEEVYLQDKFIKNICIEKDGIKKYKFPLDFFETPQTEQLGILYSKLEDSFQDEWCNLFSEEDFEKFNTFRKIMKKRSLLPLPLFNVSKEDNIYFDCFSKETSLLSKLKHLYEKRNIPFDYCLISNFNGYRFENIVNYDFNTKEIVNFKIYELSFNGYKNNKKICEILSSKFEHNKLNLLGDISFLFWNITKPEQTEKKEMSFFNTDKVFKNNPYLRQLFLENRESIINQIFKQDNTFINYRLQGLINKILNGILKTNELKERYKKTNDIKKLLLTALKYEQKNKNKKTMASITREIEEKLERFNETGELNEIENDFEAYYYAGQIIYYILSRTSSENSVLDLMSKYLLSVNNTEQLKKKVCELSSKYSHNIYDNKKWGILNEYFLKYEFENDHVKMNLIPLFIGFYANNLLFSKQGESLNNSEPNDLEGESNG